MEKEPDIDGKELIKAEEKEVKEKVVTISHHVSLH